MLGAGLVVSGLFLMLTWFGGRMVGRKGPTWGFIGAGIVAIIALLPLGYLMTYLLRVFQARGWAERAYQLCFTAAVAVPMLTGLGCSVLLCWAAIAARRRKRRRIHKRN